VFSAMMFFVTLYVQYALDYSALAAGAVFLAYTLPFALMGPVAGKVLQRFGATWPMSIGMVIVALSCVPLVLADENTGLGLVVAALAITSIGQGLAYNISTTAGMNAVSDDKAGLASGAISAIRMVALVFGIAVTGLVFKTFENDGYEEATSAAGGSLSSSELGEVQGLLSGSDEAAERLAQLSPSVASQVEDVVRFAFTDGLRAAFVFNAVVALLGAAGALIGRPNKPPQEEQVVIPSPYHSIPIATTAQMTIGT
jgi:MFS family permease